jgi:uncharacterized protein YkwD
MHRYAPRFPSKLGLLLLLLLVVAGSGSAASAQQVQKPQPGVTLTPSEKELLDEINAARTRPSEYAAYLEQLKPLYKGNSLHRPGRQALTTNEGVKAVDEAIQFLRAAKPLPPLEVSGGMCFGAGLLTSDMQKSGQTGHKGSDGSFCEDRVAKFGSWSSPIGESISYGKLAARDRVLNFLIDDGVSNRNHRKRLLDPTFKVAGVSCGDHNAMGGVCVITLAGGFKDSTAGAKAGDPAKPKGAIKF